MRPVDAGIFSGNITKLYRLSTDIVKISVVSPQLSVRHTLLGSMHQNTLDQFRCPAFSGYSPRLLTIFPSLLPSTYKRNGWRDCGIAKLIHCDDLFQLHSCALFGLGPQGLAELPPQALVEERRLLLHGRYGFVFFLHCLLFLSFFSFSYQSSFETLITLLIPF